MSEPIQCDPSPRTPSGSAERMRELRARRRQGLIVVPFQVRQSEIDGLVRRGLLDPAKRADRHEIGRALGKLLDRWRV